MSALRTSKVWKQLEGEGFQFMNQLSLLNWTAEHPTCEKTKLGQG